MHPEEETQEEVAEVTSIALTREERLEFENIQLKIQMAQDRMNRMIQDRAAWERRIMQDHQVDITGWNIDITAGTITRPQVPKAVPG